MQSGWRTGGSSRYAEAIFRPKNLGRGLGSDRHRLAVTSSFPVRTITPATWRTSCRLHRRIRPDMSQVGSGSPDMINGYPFPLTGSIRAPARLMAVVRASGVSRLGSTGQWHRLHAFTWTGTSLPMNGRPKEEPTGGIIRVTLEFSPPRFHSEAFIPAVRGPCRGSKTVTASVVRLRAGRNRREHVKNQ